MQIHTMYQKILCHQIFMKKAISNTLQNTAMIHVDKKGEVWSTSIKSIFAMKQRYTEIWRHGKFPGIWYTIKQVPFAVLINQSNKMSTTKIHCFMYLNLKCHPLSNQYYSEIVLTNNSINIYVELLSVVKIWI